MYKKVDFPDCIISVLPNGDAYLVMQLYSFNMIDLHEELDYDYELSLQKKYDPGIYRGTISIIYSSSFNGEHTEYDATVEVEVIEEIKVDFPPDLKTYDILHDNIVALVEAGHIDELIDLINFNLDDGSLEKKPTNSGILYTIFLAVKPVLQLQKLNKQTNEGLEEAFQKISNKLKDRRK